MSLFLDHVSLQRRLPALMAGGLILVVAGYGAVAYRATRERMLETAIVRLETAAARFQELTGPGLANRIATVADVARDQRIVDFLQNGTHLDAALAALERLGPDTGQTIAVGLRGPGNEARASLRRPLGHPPEARAADRPQASNLIQRGDSVLFEVTAPVVAGDSVIGRVVQIRALRGNPRTVELLSEMIGDDAELLVGNIDGSLWTDFTSVTTRPPPALPHRRYDRNGRTRWAASRPIDGTPLVIAVEFPEDRILAPARGLLLQFTASGALVIAIGVLAAWLASRNITKPLESLAAAADDVSKGAVPSGALPVTRKDEIGQLARAFDRMATDVRAAREHLEEQVAARTRELREAQEELVQRERLATLGQVSGGIGHELRNPLGVMSNAVYYLEATLRDAPPKAREYLGVLRRQIATAEQIVTNLLGFARAKPPLRQAINPVALVEEQLARVSVPSSIRVERQLECDLPAVSADPVQIGQVLVNVLTNAVQAMEQGGGVMTIRAARGQAGRVRITVKDTGPGIPAEHVDRIFEPLFTTKARGMGLGLAVSRTLARVNGGDLYVTNNVPGGAAFTLELPIGEPS